MQQLLPQLNLLYRNSSCQKCLWKWHLDIILHWQHFQSNFESTTVIFSSSTLAILAPQLSTCSSCSSSLVYFPAIHPARNVYENGTWILFCIGDTSSLICNQQPPYQPSQPQPFMHHNDHISMTTSHMQQLLRQLNILSDNTFGQEFLWIWYLDTFLHWQHSSLIFNQQ